MNDHSLRRPVLAAVALAALAAVAPAATSSGLPPPAAPGQGPAGGAETAPAGTAGELTPLAVLPLGLDDQLRRRFPELAGRSTGLGVHALLGRELATTGRFRLVAARPEEVADLLNRQWVASTGAADADLALSYGRLLGVRYVVWGEVYDFGSRRVKRKTVETGLAVQLRVVDVTSGAEASSAATGTAVRRGEVFSLAATPDFADSPLGAAAEAAFAEAVPQLLARLPDLVAAER